MNPKQIKDAARLESRDRFFKDKISELTSEVAALDEALGIYSEKIEKLQAENAKLRECVEKVAYSYDRPTDMMKNARQVLKEIGEE